MFVFDMSRVIISVTVCDVNRKLNFQWKAHVVHKILRSITNLFCLVAMGTGYIVTQKGCSFLFNPGGGSSRFHLD